MSCQLLYSLARLSNYKLALRGRLQTPPPWIRLLGIGADALHEGYTSLPKQQLNPAIGMHTTGVWTGTYCIKAIDGKIH